MTITLNHVEDFHFRADAGSGVIVDLDGGDTAHGLSPMQHVAAAAGACSAIDVVDILRKGRFRVEAMRVEVEAERAERPPRVFTRLALHFALETDAPPDRVERAVRLSLDTYCSVTNMLRHTAAVTASFELGARRYEVS